MNAGFTLICNKCGNKIHVKDYDGSEKSIDEENEEIKFHKYRYSDFCYEIECIKCANIIAI